jgi:hypothetical protein
MKIICVDNFDRDSVDDKLICSNVDRYYGEKIVEMLNNCFSGDHSPLFYKLVEDNYVLYKYQW